jgi:hypothetical protein
LRNQNTPHVPTFTVGMQGRYKIEAIQPDGTTRLLADWFDNLITDIGMNRLGAGASVQWCSVGTGTTQPVQGDTGLQAPIAFTNTYTTSYAAQSSAPYYQTNTRIFTFAQGAVVGNISEVGVGWSGTNGTLFSRARIKDGGGVDTTITVTAIEQLSVTYQLRLNIPSTDVVTTPTINGQVTTVTVRAGLAASAQWSYILGYVFDGRFGLFSPTLFFGTYNGPIGAVTGTPSGTNLGNSESISTTAYSNNSYYTEFVVNWTISQGNDAGGIDSIDCRTNPGVFQIGFVPPILKLNTQTMQMTYRLAWSRT